MSIMSRISIVTFRVNVPNATPADAPVRVELQPMSNALHKIIIFSTGAVDISKAGFKIKNFDQTLIPDIGSNDNIVLAAQEQGWAPLVNASITLNFGGREIGGTPFSLTLEFYNTTGAAILVGGFVHTSMPQYDLSDLVREIKKVSEASAALRVEYDRQIRQSEKSTIPPYPVQQVKNK